MKPGKRLQRSIARHLRYLRQMGLTDRLAGYRNTPFQGVGIAGQTVGPYGTLLRLDIGKTVGGNSQTGFVANVLFLKLF